jgi:serine protease Do
MRVMAGRFAALFLLLVCGLGLAPRGAAAHDPSESFATIVDPLLPSVVLITTWAPADASTPVGPNGVKPDRAPFYGSGFIIDPSGVIVTNQHVIANAFSIVVHFTGGGTALGRVLASNASVDLAVVKVDVDHPLPAMTFGDSDKLRVGDPVIAIGNPLGVGLSVSAGVVSALNRDITMSAYGDFIQTDAAINHGNSGGPLVDMQGRVVGVDSSLYNNNGTGSIGLGYAIPSNIVQFVVQRLLKYGAIRAGWIGVELQDVGQALSMALHIDQPNTSVIAEVAPGSPAEKAGLEDGDILLTVNGQNFPSSQAIMREIARTKVGDSVAIDIWREGKVTLLKVPVIADPADRMEAGKPMEQASWTIPSALGLHLQPITDELRNRYGIAPDTQGLVITAVDANSPAADRGLMMGDLVVRTLQKTMSSEADFETAVSQARSLKLPYLPILVRRGHIQRWIPLGAT